MKSMTSVRINAPSNEMIAESSDEPGTAQKNKQLPQTISMTVRVDAITYRWWLSKANKAQYVRELFASDPQYRSYVASEKERRG